MTTSQHKDGPQGPSSKTPKLRIQSADELEAKFPDGIPRRTAEQRAKYGFSEERLKAEWEEEQTWWPEQSRAIMEECRRSDYARRCAEDDLLHALKEAGLLKANVRRRDGEDIMESVWRVAEGRAVAKAKAALPKLSRAERLFLEMENDES